MERKEIEFADCKLLLEKDDDHPQVRVFQEIETEIDGRLQKVWWQISEDPGQVSL